MRLIAEGGAVATMATAWRDFPRSIKVAVARKNSEVVGTSAIKPVRDRDNRFAELAEFPFDHDTPELGCVVVDPRHRGKKLKSFIPIARRKETRTFSLSQNSRHELTSANLAGERLKHRKTDR